MQTFLFISQSHKQTYSYAICDHISDYSLYIVVIVYVHVRLFTCCCPFVHWTHHCESIERERERTPFVGYTLTKKITHGTNKWAKYMSYVKANWNSSSKHPQRNNIMSSGVQKSARNKYNTLTYKQKENRAFIITGLIVMWCDYDFVHHQWILQMLACARLRPLCTHTHIHTDRLQCLRESPSTKNENWTQEK